MAPSEAAFPDPATRLHTHEAVCAERYARIDAALQGIAGRIGRIEGLILAFAAGVGATAAGTVILGLL